MSRPLCKINRGTPDASILKSECYCVCLPVPPCLVWEGPRCWSSRNDYVNGFLNGCLLEGVVQCLTYCVCVCVLRVKVRIHGVKRAIYTSMVFHSYTDRTHA